MTTLPKSSYEQNNYGNLFYALSMIYKPKVAVELGVLEGYSLIDIASPMRRTGDIAYGYDLFEDYEFKHDTQENVQDRLNAFHLDNIKLIKQDAFEAAKNHEDESVDLLHIDLSNDGEKLKRAFSFWFPKVKIDGLILFEGGSKDRDENEWMKKYDREPIFCFMDELRNKYKVDFITLSPYPSLTIVRKFK